VVGDGVGTAAGGGQTGRGSQAIDIRTQNTTALQFEDALNDTNFGGSGIQTTERAPVVDHETGTDDVRTSVDSTRHQRDLEQRAQFIEILDSGTGVNQASLVSDLAVRANQGVTSNRLAKHFNAKHIRYYVLGVSVQVGVHQGHVVVADDAVAQGGQTLLDSLDDNAIRYRVSQVHELVISCRARHKETSLVADSHSPNKSTTIDGGVNNGDVLGQLLFEYTVKVLTSTNCAQGIRIGNIGEDTDFIRVLELTTSSHISSLNVQSGGIKQMET
jgi:hypothetical protein